MASLLYTRVKKRPESPLNGSFCILVLDRLLLHTPSDNELSEVVIPKFVAEKPEEETKSVVQSSEEGSDTILSANVSPDGRHLAVCDDRKRLLVWTSVNNQKWTLMSVRSLVRRCTSLQFTYSSDEVLVCDKSGDVYAFSLINTDKDGELIKGHLSMMLDMFVSEDDKYVITCDRDEKIHVSHYPNSYNIQTFCLGHTEFVSSLADLHREQMFVSASGDGTIRLWNYITGQLLQTITCADHVISNSQSVNTDQTMTSQSDHVTSIKTVYSDGDPLVVRTMKYDVQFGYLATTYHKKSLIMIYHMSPDDVTLKPAHCLSCDGEVLDVTFDCDGSLFALQSAQNLLLSFRRNEDGTFQRQSKNHSALVANVNSQAHLFKGLDDRKSLLPSLYKAKVDNLKDYLAKKEERIREVQCKKKMKTLQ